MTEKLVLAVGELTTVNFITKVVGYTKKTTDNKLK